MESRSPDRGRREIEAIRLESRSRRDRGLGTAAPKRGLRAYPALGEKVCALHNRLLPKAFELDKDARLGSAARCDPYDHHGFRLDDVDALDGD